MKHEKNSGGYTLVELFVSVAVLLCFTSLVLPSLSGVNTRRTVTLKTWEIKRHLEYTRSIAITRNKEITLCIATLDYRCVRKQGSRLLVFEDTDNNRRWTSEEVLYRDTKLGKATVELSASFGSSIIHFKGNGESKHSGNFKVCEPGIEPFARQVIFFRSGRVRLSGNSDMDGYDNRSSSPILCN